tara:strand:- start:427 stop:672 length:246 start_codon:yes stop_codon:yes gene_type:complete
MHDLRENIDKAPFGYWTYSYHRLFAAVANYQPFAIAVHLHARQLAGYAALVTKHVTLNVSSIIAAVIKISLRIDTVFERNG